MAYAKPHINNGRPSRAAVVVPANVRRYMRVVTYARVSTKSQSDRGLSLEDQERRFAAFLKSNKADRVKAYAEAKSAGTVAQRKTFVMMFEELPELQVDALVIDSLDRFTRDKFLGAEQFGKLREMGVKLWELEHDEGRPLDMTVEADRDYVWDKFAGAESERRRIQKRARKRYQGERERGATTTNRPAFGLRRAGPREQRRLEPDPETAPIVQEVDRRILAGQSQRIVLAWAQAMSPKAWRTRRGLQLALLDDDGAYVAAGVRTAETAAKLRALKGARVQAYGTDRACNQLREHELSGLVACGKCVAADIPPERALMHGRYIAGNTSNPFNVACDGRRDGREIHKGWMMTANQVEALLREKIRRLNDPRAREAVVHRLRYPKARRTKGTRDLRRGLERRLAELDRVEAELDQEVRNAMRFTQVDDPAVAAEAQQALAAAGAERAAVRQQRAVVVEEMAALPNATVSEAQIQELDLAFWNIALFEEGIQLTSEGEFDTEARLRDLLKPFIVALGPPIVDRKPPLKGRKIRNYMQWALIDEVSPPHRKPPEGPLDLPPDVLERVHATAPILRG